MSELQSYKPYARLVTAVSGILLIISILDANQLINLFPAHASTITTILGIKPNEHWLESIVEEIK